MLAICEGIERIIRTETIEGETRAEVGSDMNKTGTEMVIIAAIGLAVLVLITVHHPVAVWLKSCICNQNKQQFTLSSSIIKKW